MNRTRSGSTSIIEPIAQIEAPKYVPSVPEYSRRNIVWEGPTNTENPAGSGRLNAASQGQTRHMYLVMLAYSLLMQQLRRRRAKDWAMKRLTTIGQACRAVADETLRTTLQWAMTQITENSRKPKHVIAQLGLN